MPDAKPFWTSRQLWINAVALAASLGAGAGFDIPGEEQGALVAGIMAAVNIVLRLVTTKAVTVHR